MSDIATAQGSEPPLDWPYYGIGFGAAIKRFFAKYATFTGRASRGEYWWAYLFSMLVFLVLYGIFIAGIVVASTAASSSGTDPQFGAGFYAGSSLLSLFVLATIVPNLAVTVRRLHDAGHSGWFVLLGLIPAVGGIILIVLLASATNPAAEMYGPPRSQGGYGGGYGQLPQQPYGQPQQAFDPGQAYNPGQQYGQQPSDGGQQYGQQQPYDPPRS
jgi:uncharacterized membrane protein YhaH (DUF805 family)